FALSAGMKLMRHPEVIKGMSHLGLPESLIMPLGVIELLCVVLYLVPKTSILGDSVHGLRGRHDHHSPAHGRARVPPDRAGHRNLARALSPTISAARAVLGASSPLSGRKHRPTLKRLSVVVGGVGPANGAAFVRHFVLKVYASN